MTDEEYHLCSIVVNLDVENLIGRRRGSQKKIIDEFQAKFQQDMHS